MNTPPDSSRLELDRVLLTLDDRNRERVQFTLESMMAATRRDGGSMLEVDRVRATADDALKLARGQ